VFTVSHSLPESLDGHAAHPALYLEAQERIALTAISTGTAKATFGSWPEICTFCIYSTNPAGGGSVSHRGDQ